MAITQTLDGLPEAPSRNDPANFVTEADAFVAGMVTYQTQANTWASQANELADNANTDATTATTQAAAAIASAGATVYASGSTYGAPDVVVGSNGHSYRCLSTGTIGDNPVGSVTGDWQVITLSAASPVSIITTSTTAVDGYTYGISTATSAVTLTLPASPVAGLSFVRCFDPTGDWGTNNVTIGRNSLLIMDTAENMTCDIPYDSFELRYMGAGSGGWRIG